MSCRKENEWTRKNADGLAISESLLKSAYSGHPFDLQSSQGEQMSSDTRSDAKKNAMLTRILEDSDYLDGLFIIEGVGVVCGVRRVVAG